MASSSGPTGGGGLDIKSLKEQLYTTTISVLEDLDVKHIKQADIEEMGIEGMDDLNDMLQVVQALVDEKLFKLVQDDGSIAWKVRSRDEAKRYRVLKPEEAVVYELIDDAGQDGIWTKTIKTKTNLHDSHFNQAIKHLSGKGYIMEMKSVEHPSRKMWIKASLQPSERATGGPWYTDGELDEEFISHVMRFLTEAITRQTFYASKLSSATKKPKKVHGKKMTTEEAKAARASALGPQDEDAVNEREEKRRRFASYLPMPVTYKGYPNIDDLTLLLDTSGLTKDVVLTNADVQQLLDIMIYDGLISRVVVGDNVGYKSQRSSLLDPDDLSSVLTEAPCGRCPVFDLCEEGGPVGPSNCEYFNEWLGL